MAANNEIGTVMPIKEIGLVAKKKLHFIVMLFRHTVTFPLMLRK